jgi:hypothetical protein
MDFLVHLITAEGAAPVQKHVATIQEFPRLQSFLGLVNFIGDSSQRLPRFFIHSQRH